MQTNQQWKNRRKKACSIAPKQTVQAFLHFPISVKFPGKQPFASDMSQ